MIAPTGATSGFCSFRIAFIFSRKRIEFDRELQVAYAVSKLATSERPLAKYFTFREFLSEFSRHFLCSLPKEKPPESGLSILGR